MVRRLAVCIAALSVAAPMVASCSSSSTSKPPVTICDPGKSKAQSDADLPAAGDIRTAIADLEKKLGGQQHFFEVNATARLVNLFVALNNGTIAQPWTWVHGALTSREGQAAKGGTFTAADLDFEPKAMFSDIRKQIPEATLESLYINGDGKGNVVYGVISSAKCGGGLDITVSPAGKVKTVMPVD
jgi:hypothetical protein